MLIEKIDENKIEVILTIQDLKNNNIDLQTFMSNSIQNQGIFFKILQFSYENIGFNIANCNFNVETFAVPLKSFFVVIINRIMPLKKLHKPQILKKHFNFNEPYIFKFDNFEDLCMFCNSLNNNIKTTSKLYLYKNNYYLFLHLKCLHNRKNFLYLFFEFNNHIHNKNEILQPQNVVISNNAIEIFKKYF